MFLPIGDFALAAMRGPAMALRLRFQRGFKGKTQKNMVFIAY
jgi:hypothetical protein